MVSKKAAKQGMASTSHPMPSAGVATRIVEVPDTSASMLTAMAMAVDPTPPDDDAVMVNLTPPVEPQVPLAAATTPMEVDTEPATGAMLDANSIDVEPSTEPKSDLSDVNTSDIDQDLPDMPNPPVPQ